MFRAPFTDSLDPETGQGQAHPDYAYGAHAVEVAVDVETGKAEVLKSVAAHDVGQCINPAAAPCVPRLEAEQRFGGLARAA